MIVSHGFVISHQVLSQHADAKESNEWCVTSTREKCTRKQEGREELVKQ